jgi:hypothetical protein
MNEATAKVPTSWVDYFTLKSGDWFWTHNPDPSRELSFPMFKIDGGYVSPANGAFCADDKNPYDKIIPCPRGTVVMITVGTRHN